LVAKIVGDHGGIVECESQPRRTIFRVLLPMYNPSKTPNQTSNDEHPGTPSPASHIAR
jgi:two-component system nitrogen regulation sensor histidine kinase GlnL